MKKRIKKKQYKIWFAEIMYGFPRLVSFEKETGEFHYKEKAQAKITRIRKKQGKGVTAGSVR